MKVWIANVTTESSDHYSYIYMLITPHEKKWSRKYGNGSLV